MFRRACALVVAPFVVLVVSIPFAPAASAKQGRPLEDVVTELRVATDERESLEDEERRYVRAVERRKAARNAIRSEGEGQLAAVADKAHTLDKQRARIMRREDAVQQRTIDAYVRTGSAVLPSGFAQRQDDELARLREKRSAVEAELERLDVQAAAVRVEIDDANRGLRDRRHRLEELRASRQAVDAEILRLSEEREGIEAARTARRAKAAQAKAEKERQAELKKAQADPHRFGLPHPGVVTSTFGPRWGRPHQGIDIAGAAGEPIRASKGGVVETAGVLSGYGNVVIVDHGDGFSSLYAHLSEIGVAPGQPVKKGARVGALGCTGTCYGDHVHFEIRVGGVPHDPMPHLPA